MATARGTPMVLCILDGWGEGDGSPGDAIRRAKTPHWDAMRARGLYASLEASGPGVGLPEGQMGNSEVGHLNIGAGRIVFQDIVRIDRDIETGRFAENTVLRDVLAGAKERGSRVHLAGLIGPGGVHSHERHMDALLEMAAAVGHREVQVHAILDGRDTAPRSAGPFLEHLEATLASTGAGRIATVAGRYYTMDRDQRWERTEAGYRAMVDRDGPTAPSAVAALESSYADGVTDEFLVPRPIEGGRPIEEGDTFIFVNFRPDRARQITRALAEPGFDGFASKPLALDYVCMTQYDDAFLAFAKVAYEPERPTMTLGEQVSLAGLRQLRIAETEKYAHVTYFFSGGREDAFEGEERLLVPSPKVATYDLQPEMSAPAVTEELVRRLKADDPPDLVVLNYANPDMVGHTGVFDASVRAVEVIDGALGRLAEAVAAAGGTLVVTADHGNVEEMVDDEGGPITKHSTNPVPLLILPAAALLPAGTSLRSRGILADVSPTLLDMMGLVKPAVMDRESLLVRTSASLSDPLVSG